LPVQLSAERWRVVIPYLDRALELDGAPRAAWIDALHREDRALADDVVALLEQHEVLDAEGYLDEVAAARPPRASLAGQVLGAYTLRDPIGQGGMGSVWLAERTDGRYRGTAAVKLLNPSLVDREGEGRFRREGSILARLRHPHIAQLIDAGVSPAGQPYLVLEHVDGQRIDLYCDEHAMAVEARVRLFLDVLGAVAHAHANLVVHRDLKPSNVMVGADGRVKLLDFGIAKLVEPDPAEAAAFTATGAHLMTPLYAAPEQLTGDGVTTATDVYALGALFYLLLTGRHPSGSDASSPAELVRAIVDAEALRPSEIVVLERPGQQTPAQAAGHRSATPRRLAAALRGDLDNVVAKALKKLPSERYPSAEAMADDLRRHLEHRPVRARADSLSYRSRKFVARNRIAMAAAAVTAAALLAGSGVALWQARKAARDRDHALAQLHRAEAAIDFTGFLLAEATPTDERPVTNAELLERGEAVLDRRYGADPAVRVEMLLLLADQYFDNADFDRWRSTLDRAFEASQGLTDVGLRARVKCARAWALSDLGPRHPTSQATADALIAEAIADLAGLPDSMAEEAACRVAESTIAITRGEEARAIGAASRAVELERLRGGSPQRRFEAGLALADALMVTGRATEADRSYREVLAMLDAQGLGESRRAAGVLNNLGVMWLNHGQPARALPITERAARIARRRDVARGAGASLIRSHGVALCGVGRCAEALPLLEESVVRARREGAPRRVLNALTWQAYALGQVGEIARAAEALRQADAVVAADPRASAFQRALIDRTRARLDLVRGDAARALVHVHTAAARGADALLANERMKLDLLLAEASNEQEQFREALAAADRALAVAQSDLGDQPCSADVAQAQLERGIALARLGDLASGRAQVAEALHAAEQSAGPASSTALRARRQLARLAASH
jgi:serine/threonine-protein kinase